MHSQLVHFRDSMKTLRMYDGQHEDQTVQMTPAQKLLLTIRSLYRAHLRCGVPSFSAYSGYLAQLTRNWHLLLTYTGLFLFLHPSLNNVWLIQTTSTRAVFATSMIAAFSP